MRRRAAPTAARCACRPDCRPRAALLSPARTALFSLGNLAAHPRCREALHALGLPAQLAELEGLDSTLLKYSRRIAHKLDLARPNTEGA